MKGRVQTHNPRMIPELTVASAFFSTVADFVILCFNSCALISVLIAYRLDVREYTVSKTYRKIKLKIKLTHEGPYEQRKNQTGN